MKVDATRADGPRFRPPRLLDFPTMITRRSALIVTLGRDRGALAAARALSRAGWFVGIGTPDGGGMVGRSRHCSRRHVVPRPRGDATDFLAGVQTALTREPYDIVFGGGDDWIGALAAHRDAIAARVAHPPVKVISAVLDKVRLTELARAAGLAAPRIALATDEAMRDWRGPVVVKCRSHWEPGQTGVQRVESRTFSAVDAAARARVDLIRSAGLRPVLQQPVDGQMSALIGLFHHGRLRGRVQQLAPRLWPTPSGVSARAHTVPVDDRLAARVEELLDGVGWTGLAELQFLTAADQPPQLIDLNGRFYGSMALADAAGPGLADAWGRQVLGEQVPFLVDGRPGVRFAWAAGDLRRAVSERRGGLVPDVFDTLRWTAGARESVWEAADPGPLLHLLTERFRKERMPAAPEKMALAPVELRTAVQ